MSNKLEQARRRKLELAKHPCVRCKRMITNPLHTKPWCVSCAVDLREMSFNGEQVLELFMAAMPPAPANVEARVPVIKVLEITRRVLVSQNIMMPDLDGGDLPPKIGLVKRIIRRFKHAN